ncbi:MAG: hypothetical protein IT319_03160 [Anaerolineae bacterium]|nr:hypothetical protein [Anaerolineae bacterium]
MIRTGQPFASVAKGALIILLLFSFVLIAQNANKSVYQLGLLLLVFFTLLQIVFGNIPSTANFRQTLVYLLVGAVIIVALVVFSVAIAPSLIHLGR